MKKKYPLLFMILVFVMLGAGCNNHNDNKDSRLALMKTTQPTPINLKEKGKSVSDQVKDEVLKNKKIYDAAVIEGKKEILVAYKVKHMYRFNMKGIEKNLNNHLKKKFPGKEFAVSSDYKIFLEAVRLKQSLDSGKMSDREARKRFNSIIKLKDELT